MMTDDTNPWLKKTLHDVKSTDQPVDPADIIDTITLKINDFTPWDMNVGISPRRYCPNGRKRTAFDIDYRWNTDFVDGKYIQVVVTIPSSLWRWVEFIPRQPNHAPECLALTGGNDVALEMLRNLEMGAHEIKFLLKWMELPDHPEADPPAPMAASFNLGFLFTDTNDPDRQIPIIFDPTVPNDGH